MTMQTAHKVNPTFTPVTPGTEHIKLVPVAPAGDYSLLIDGADYIPARHGAFLRLAMHVAEGIRFGTPIVIDLHLEHVDDRVHGPAQEEFRQLMNVIGYPKLEDTEDLIGCCFRATIGKRQASAAHRTENYFSAVHEGAWTPDGERAEVARSRPAPITVFPDIYGLITAEPMGDIPEGETLWFDTAERPCKGAVVAVHARDGRVYIARLAAALPPGRWERMPFRESLASTVHAAASFHLFGGGAKFEVMQDLVAIHAMAARDAEVEDAYGQAPQRDERGRFLKKAA
jgi:hypothetical protein